MKNCKDSIAFMILGGRSSELFGVNYEFYVAKGFIRKFDTLKELCEHYKLDFDSTVAELKEYNEIQDTGKADKFGKTVFPNKIDPVSEACYYGCELTPSLHYTMGGLKIDVNGHVQSKDNGSIKGLYAAGESTGGIHGKNRLAGNSLMECVVFGRKIGLSVINDAKTSS